MGNLLTCVKVKDNGKNEDDEAFEDEADEGIADEANKVTEDCLRNPVIVKNILKNFSSSELLKLSLVSKLWKYEARSVMGKRGDLMAYLKYNDLDQVNLDDPPARGAEIDSFISDLKDMNPVPFSGISIDIYFERCFDPFPIGALDPLQGLVLDLPILKTLSVQLQGTWLKNLASPGFLLVKKLLQDCSGILQQLTLEIDYDRKDFVEKVVQDLTFPRLQILKLREMCFEPDEEQQTLYGHYMKALMSRSPNLKVLSSCWPINLTLSVLEGTSILPVYGFRIHAPFHEISEDMVGVIMLEVMKMEHYGDLFDFERFNRITPMFLQQSCSSTLRCMWLDAVLAIPLMSYGIGLKKVKYLNLYINFSHLDHVEPRILRIIKNFNFTQIFPNLNKVDIVAYNEFSRPSQSQMSGVVEQANAALWEPMPDRAVNVKALCLHQKNLSSVDAEFFAEMFPNIENLEIRTPGDENVPFESIWENWPDLKELEVRGHMLPAAGNLDSAFCGIFPEEVAELRLKGDEYLKKVNIVPVMPALTCLKNLRVLSLNHRDRIYDHFEDDATFLFSKVTALVAFARMKELAVSLDIFSYSGNPALVAAMAELQPYVCITSGRLQDEDWCWDRRIIHLVPYMGVP